MRGQVHRSGRTGLSSLALRQERQFARYQCFEPEQLRHPFLSHPNQVYAPQDAANHRDSQLLYANWHDLKAVAFEPFVLPGLKVALEIVEPEILKLWVNLLNTVASVSDVAELRQLTVAHL